uniref:Outer membrane protein n=1 Tax=Borrelia turicatae TaxID=142 RepID=V5JFZ7_BORTU|nr:outer membrane protein [Borrelia turicatae]
MKKINLLIFLISIISIMLGCDQGLLNKGKKHVGKAISPKNPVNGAIDKLDVSRSLLTREIRENSGTDILKALRVGNVEVDVNKQNKGAGEQGNVEQGNVEQGNVEQGNVEQGNVEQGNVEQGNVEQGNVEQGNGGQGNGKQVNGGQGNVEQGNVEQVNGGQVARDLAYKIFTIRLKNYRDTLNSMVDEFVFVQAGFDPTTSLFGDQNISEGLQDFNQPHTKNKIYLTLENNIKDVLTLKSIFKNLDLSIEHRDPRYDGSETSVMVGVLYRLRDVSEYSSYNLSMNFNEKKLDLINNCDSADKISEIDLKLEKFIDIRKDVIYNIQRKLYFANAYRANKERMLDSLKEITEPKGNIRLAIDSLFKLSQDIGHLISSL